IQALANSPAEVSAEIAVRFVLTLEYVLGAPSREADGVQGRLGRKSLTKDDRIDQIGSRSALYHLQNQLRQPCSQRPQVGGAALPSLATLHRGILGQAASGLGEAGDPPVRRGDAAGSDA